MGQILIDRDDYELNSEFDLMVIGSYEEYILVCRCKFIFIVMYLLLLRLKVCLKKIALKR